MSSDARFLTTRRDFLRFTGAGLLTAGLARCTSPAGPASRSLYVGTYTSGESTSEGIYLVRMSESDGSLEMVGLAASSVSPSFLAVHPSGKFVYSANETGEFEGERQGYLTAFRVDEQNGMLVELNRRGSGGGGPCYVSLDPSGKILLAANYGGGSVIAYAVEADGGLGARTGFVQHEGSGGDPARQSAPHAHSIVASPDGRFALAVDLGIDKVMVYGLGEDGSLNPNDPAFGAVAPASGPRHLAFSPDARFVYVVNELSSSVTPFRYVTAGGVLEPMAAVSTLPPGYAETSYCADIHVHPGGRFLYASNRGHDSIAVFRIDPASGDITWLDAVSTGGNWPRNFALSPDGRFLLAANQRSASIVVFRIDEETGLPVETGSRLEVDQPACIKFS